MVDHDFDVFDLHQHVGSPGEAFGEGARDDLDADAARAAEVAGRLAFMDRLRISRTAVIPSHSYDRATGIEATRTQNDAIARYRDALPARFAVAVGVVEPLDRGAAVDELSRIAIDLSFKGVSFHTVFQGVNIDDPWMIRILEKTIELDLVPLIHASNIALHEALWRLGKVARAFPDAPIVALEPFFTHDGVEECSFIADVAPNVIFDTASCRQIQPMISLVKSIGADRVAYGSQFYSRPSSSAARRSPEQGMLILDEIVHSDRLTNAEKGLVVGGNAARLFGLPVRSHTR